MPDGDADLHPVAVAERLGGFRHFHGIAEDDDPLLLHAEGGNLGKGGRFHAADAAPQRSLAAPLFDLHRVSGADRHGVAGEDFRLDLDVRGIADLQDGCARGNDHFALLHHLEQAAGDGRFHLHEIAGEDGFRPVERGTGLGELVVDDLQGKLRGTHFRGADRGVALHFVAVGLRQGAFTGDGAHPVAVGIRHFQGRAAGIERLGGSAARGLVHGNHGLGLKACARIEQRRGDRLDGGQDGLARLHIIARLEWDAAHFPGHGRGDDVTVSHPGLALLRDADGQRPADGGAGLDDDRPRPQPPRDEP